MHFMPVFFGIFVEENEINQFFNSPEQINQSHELIPAKPNFYIGPHIKLAQAIIIFSRNLFLERGKGKYEPEKDCAKSSTNPLIVNAPTLQMQYMVP